MSRAMLSERRHRSFIPVALLVFAGLRVADAAAQSPPSGLRSPESFATIVDESQRSQALFTELGKVLTHPRCLNCHPVGDRPRQGEQGRLHQPPVARGPDGFGVDGLRCPICHQSANFDPGRVPGHPEWHLAPFEMGWYGKSLHDICVQIKDPARNGGRSAADLIHHIGEDTLVGWAWAPGFGREPAPGTQQAAGALVEAWVKTGAACPD
jgi:hypothetical protein